MTLRNNLYTVTDRCEADGVYAYSLVLNADCVIYQAHFPGQPITPGVCIVQMVQELLEDAVGKRLSVCCVKNAKFLAVMHPTGQTVSVTLSHIKMEGETYSVQALVAEQGGTNYAKISLQATVA